MTTSCDSARGTRGVFRADVAHGFRAAAPAGLGFVPIGIAFGLLVLQLGLPWWVAPALTLTVFAGSLELLLVGMMAAIDSLAAVALTAFLVQFRHVFYAFSYPLGAMRAPLARLYGMFGLCDEAYAISSVDPKSWNQTRLLALQLSLHGFWLVGGLLGLAVGQFVPSDIEGLGFALCALFTTLTLDAARTRATLVPLLLAGLALAIAAIAFPGALLFAALLIYVLLLVARYFFERIRHA